MGTNEYTAADIQRAFLTQQQDHHDQLKPLEKAVLMGVAVPVDATTQMLAARVEGLEKELNGLQFVWGRVKALEAVQTSVEGRLERQLQALQRLEAKRLDEMPAKPITVASELILANTLLTECLNSVSPVSDLARRINNFLRGR